MADLDKKGRIISNNQAVAPHTWFSCVHSDDDGDRTLENVEEDLKEVNGNSIYKVGFISAGKSESLTVTTNNRKTYTASLPIVSNVKAGIVTPTQYEQINNGLITDAHKKSIRKFDKQIASFSCRSDISISGSVVTLSSAYWYMLFNDGERKAYTLGGTFDLRGNKRLVFDYNTNSLSVIEDASGVLGETQTVLLEYDNANGYFGGELYSKMLSASLDKINGKIDNIDSIIPNNCIVIETGNPLVSLERSVQIGDIQTKFITATQGDVIEWSSAKTNTIVTLLEVSSAIGIVDRWTQASGKSRKITINNENTTFVVAIFKSSDDYQYLKKNDVVYANIGKETTSTNTDAIPSFVHTEAMKTYKRIMNWVDGDDVYLLGHITDVHSGGNDKWKHVGYLNELNKVFGFDCICNAGDIGLDTDATKGDSTKEYELLYNTRKGMNATSPWVFCKGNHDIVNDYTIGNVFNKSFKRQFKNIVFGDKAGTYGYIDDDEKMIRTIFLNTSDQVQGRYDVTDAQLVWLVNVLNSVVNNSWKVIVCTHLCTDDIGRWNSAKGDADGRTIRWLQKIIEDYNDKSAELIWNFEDAKGTVVCVLSGDSHFNNYREYNGVNFVVRQGYGGVSESDMPDGATKDNFDSNSQCLFDVLVVKHQQGEAKIFRIGAGGETRDLEFQF